MTYIIALGCALNRNRYEQLRVLLLGSAAYFSLVVSSPACNQIGGCVIPMIGDGTQLLGTTANSTARTSNINSMFQASSAKVAAKPIPSAVQPLDVSLPTIGSNLFGITANTTTPYIDWTTGKAIKPTQKQVGIGSGFDMVQMDNLHNHMYRFHGQRQISNAPKATGTLVFTTTWDNNSSGQPDIDNHVLLPGGQGSYDRTTSTIPQRSDQPFYSAPANQQHVFSTQYDTTYNSGQSRAVLSGEVGGGGWIRNLGCSGVSTPNCERITITGRTTGTYQQQAHNFNAYNLPDQTAKYTTTVQGAGTTAIQGIKVNGVTKVPNTATGIYSWSETLHGTGVKGALIEVTTRTNAVAHAGGASLSNISSNKVSNASSASIDDFFYKIKQNYVNFINNNYINNVNHVIDLAYLADDVYRPGSRNNREFSDGSRWSLINWKTLLDESNISSAEKNVLKNMGDIYGFNANLYKSNTGKYVFAIEGTTPVNFGIIKDFTFGYGIIPVVGTGQYKILDNLINIIEKMGITYEITAHSMGGALATYTAERTGKPAFTFNPQAKPLFAYSNLNNIFGTTAQVSSYNTNINLSELSNFITVNGSKLIGAQNTNMQYIGSGGHGMDIIIKDLEVMKAELIKFERDILK